MSSKVFNNVSPGDSVVVCENSHELSRVTAGCRAFPLEDGFGELDSSYYVFDANMKSYVIVLKRLDSATEIYSVQCSFDEIFKIHHSLPSVFLERFLPDDCDLSLADAILYEICAARGVVSEDLPTLQTSSFSKNQSRGHPPLRSVDSAVKTLEVLGKRHREVLHVPGPSSLALHLAKEKLKEDGKL